jgi:predicted 3-demethylubiquinone-9 3-methyltransferase (glyoxalase superfamily)
MELSGALTSLSNNMKEQKITPFLWFDKEAVEAAEFYTSIFPHSRIIDDSQYGETGQEITGQKPGTVMTVDFELNGQRFTALNGGPVFKFNESISFVIDCKDQGEVDYYWEKLTSNGGSESQCGWCKDKFGVSWQVVPSKFSELLEAANDEQKERLLGTMFKMQKFDVAALEKAFKGE